MDKNDTITIHISDKTGKVVKHIDVTIEELVVCWMNYHFPDKSHKILT